MGHCMEPMETQVSYEFLKEQERIDGTVIGDKHYSLQPVPSLSVIDDISGKDELISDTLHNTSTHILAHLFKKPEKVENVEIKVVQKLEGKLQLLNLDFYEGLGLPEFSFAAIPLQFEADFAGVQTVEQVDKFGVKYLGEWKGNRPHGNGILTSNVCKYLGNFSCGLKHFWGREIFSKEVYEGQFVNDRRCGDGIRYTPESTETGRFDNHLIEGRIVYKNGNIYEGSLQNRKYHGTNCRLAVAAVRTEFLHARFYEGALVEGTINYANGNTYKGEIKDSSKHGRGLFTWADGSSYEGEYKLDMKHGIGTIKHNGKIYENVRFENGLMVNQGNAAQTDAISQSSELPQGWK